MTLTNTYQYIGRSNGVKAYGNSFYFYILLYAKTNGSTATGKHTVDVKMRLACTADSTFYQYYTSAHANVAGSSAFSWTAQQIPSASWPSGSITEGGVTYPRYIDLREGSVVVNVGYGVTKNVTIDASWQRLSIDGTPPNWLPSITKATASITVTLPMIAGASTITSASAVTLGNACNVVWTPLATNLYYRLKFSVGNWSNTTGVIHPASTAAYRYTGYVIPIDVASKITDSTKGTMTVTLYTYTDSGGSSQVGSADSETFQVTVPDNSNTKPSVSMSLSLVSDLASPFSGMYIQNLTKVSASITATGQYGATIKAYRMVILGGEYGSPYVSGYLDQAGNVTVTGKATDSRGYVGTKDQTINVIPYTKPAIIPATGEVGIVCTRCDGNGYITDSGTYLKIKAKRSYSPVVSNGVQHNFCRFRYRCNNGSWTQIPTESDEIDTVIEGVVTSTTSAYTIEVGVIDDLGYDSSVVIIVPSDQVEFHLREGGEGAAFGEYAQEDRVVSVAERWELKVKGDASVAGAMSVRSPEADTEAINRGYADGRYLQKSVVGDYVTSTTKDSTTGYYKQVWASGKEDFYYGRKFFNSSNPDVLDWAWKLTTSGFDGIMHIQLGAGADAPTTYCNGLVICNSSNRCNVVLFGSTEIYTNLNQAEGWLGWRKVTTTAV